MKIKVKITRENIKFPANEPWTHTELAEANGVTNQKIWPLYDKMRKTHEIVAAGSRPQPGKGKPTGLWRLATSKAQPVPVVTVIITPEPAIPATPPTPAVTPAVVVPTEAIIVPTNEPKLLPESTETKIETPVVVEVLKVEPNGVVTPSAEIDCRPPLPVVEVQKIVEDAQTLTETCPVCGHPLVAAKDATGVMVWCHQPSEICPSSENPFGHGKDEKEAYLVLVDKFSRRNSIVSIGSSRIKD